MRTHMTSIQNLLLTKTTSSDQRSTDLKARGLWYAIDNAWLDWCASEMPHWIAKYVYTFEIKESANMLVLNTKEAVNTFAKEYGNELNRYLHCIDWAKVNSEYDGIEFNPYFYAMRFGPNTMWYNGIDVPSGVIFNTDIIVDLTCQEITDTVYLEARKQADEAI